MLTDKEIGKIIRKAYDRKLFGGELTMLAAIANNCNNYGESESQTKILKKSSMFLEEQFLTGLLL